MKNWPENFIKARSVDGKGLYLQIFPRFCGFREVKISVLTNSQLESFKVRHRNNDITIGLMTLNNRPSIEKKDSSRIQVVSGSPFNDSFLI
jgi:hypothetical protein